MFVFIYDSIMYKERIEMIAGREALNIRPAFMNDAGLFHTERYMPNQCNLRDKPGYLVMLDKRNIKRSHMECVYGALIEFDDEFEREVLRKLDSYYACSMSPLGENKDTDYYHRKEVTVRTIRFDNSEDLIKYDYEVEEELRCWTYFGNIFHDSLRKRMKAFSNSKAGNVVKSFFQVFR